MSNDDDGDGVISFSELQRLVPGRDWEFFREADLDRDGVIGFVDFLNYWWDSGQLSEDSFEPVG